MNISIIISVWFWSNITERNMLCNKMDTWKLFDKGYIYSLVFIKALGIC